MGLMYIVCCCLLNCKIKFDLKFKLYYLVLCYLFIIRKDKGNINFVYCLCGK